MSIDGQTQARRRTTFQQEGRQHNCHYFSFAIRGTNLEDGCVSRISQVAGQVVNGTNTGVHSLEEKAGNCKEVEVRIVRKDNSDDVKRLQILPEHRLAWT
jgi:hypothetical protein